MNYVKASGLNSRLFRALREEVGSECMCFTKCKQDGFLLEMFFKD